MDLIKLFLVFFRIGLFAFGGTYSFLPLIEKEVIERYHWLSKEEFLDVLAMAKILPGALSIKYATYTGYKIAGFWGVMAANLGNLLVPVILIISTSVFYVKYKNLALVRNAFGMIELVIFALIVAVAFQLIKPNQLIELKSLCVILVSFILFLYTRIHPAFIIVVAAMLGLLWK